MNGLALNNKDPYFNLIIIILNLN